MHGLLAEPFVTPRPATSTPRAGIAALQKNRLVAFEQLLFACDHSRHLLSAVLP
jgi:hypothetical protein